MQKETILKLLRERGCRITKQREILIDIILQGEYVSCKEIYFITTKKKTGIGLSTVYRMVRTLEDIGALEKVVTYQLYGQDYVEADECAVKLEDGTIVQLKADTLKQVMEKGLKEENPSFDKKIVQVLIRQK